MAKSRMFSYLRKCTTLRLGRGFRFLVFLLGCSLLAAAKDAPVNAIALYDGPQGAAYVQITGLTLNGKTEVRICDGIAKFDKKTYDAFPRATFGAAKSLQRGADGVLTLTTDDKPFCVVPNNLKFDNKREFTPTEAAQQAIVQGTPVSSSASAVRAISPGVQLVFVTAPDVELAEYLRAQRANTIKDWQDFVARYPTSTHQTAARNAIAGLHQQAAQAAFAEYQKLRADGKEHLRMLREAWLEVQAANQASSGYEPASKLMDAITRELDGLLDADRARLQGFRKALQDHTSGYSQLAAARVHLERLSQVRPDYAPVLNLHNEVGTEDRKIEMAVADAESLEASARYDDALNSLGPYTAFASEMPRVDVIINAAYRYHFDTGQKLAVQQNWDAAVTEFRKAAAIRADSKEAASALNNATIQFSAQRDQQEAKLALAQSNDYASKGDFVEAYKVLADLPEKQCALVAPQISALANKFVIAATLRAQKLQEVHIPIKNRSDEDGVHEAYVLLDQASSLSRDPAITLKRDFLASKISVYYADQANRYLEKPAGSGAGVGWLYLKQAQRYGITNLSYLKDQVARYAPLYQRRARISVGIVLRDQTSRRDSPGFADQMTDAIATALESSGVSLEVVRKSPESGDILQPNFMLVGEVLEHRVVKNVNVEAPQSKYRAGTHETKNPAWLQCKTDYESAQQQLSAAQQVLSNAQSQRKKKDIVVAAEDAVQEAQKHTDELRQKLEMTDQNLTEPIVEPYHYTKKTVDLSGFMELAFRINDRSGNMISQPVDVRKTNHKTIFVLQDVKPEDTEGITNQGVEPDVPQFLTDLEIESRNALVKAVQQRASELPANVLQEARNRVQHGDLDGAAEQYVMYLNSSPESASPERDEAAKFLRERFNLAAPVSSKL